MQETLNVLITDDEPGMRLAVSRVLKDFRFTLPEAESEISFTVSEVETGEQALEFLKKSHVDILLLDCRLPGMDGLDVLSELSNTHQDLIPVMMTAYASIEAAVAATKKGAFDFLAKPFTPDELKSVIRKASRQLILQRQTKRLLDEKNQVRFQFISVLAHEMKAPLAAVEGFLNIMHDRSAGNDEQVYRKMIERSLVRLDGMRKMILDLLDLTSIESGQRRRDFRSVDFGLLIEKCLELHTSEAQQKSVSLDMIITSPVSMNADSWEMEIILNNLISNAIKYNRKGGTVLVEVSRNNGKVRLCVSDTGIGLTEADQSKLFREFVRVKNDMTREILGSGLGLSIVRRLAQLYHGEVSVCSEFGKGSTFVVEFPLSSSC